MSNKYNAAGVTTTTPKNDQYIFMDAQYNANYDVDVLASAFNMDKATFSGKLKLIDDFTTFNCFCRWFCLFFRSKRNYSLCTS